MNASNGLILALACAAIGILFGIVWALWINKQPTGNDRMREIAAAIQQGATAYLNRQYATIAVVGAILFVLICHRRISILLLLFGLRGVSLQ